MGVKVGKGCKGREGVLRQGGDVKVETGGKENRGHAWKPNYENMKIG